MFLSFLILGVYMTSSVVIEVVDEDEDDHVHFHDRPGARTRGVPDASVMAFVPFPFTEQQVQPPPYRRGTPEWAAFEKISKDQKLKTKLKSKLPFPAESLRLSPCLSLEIMSLYGHLSLTMRIRGSGKAHAGYFGF